MRTLVSDYQVIVIRTDEIDIGEKSYPTPVVLSKFGVRSISGFIRVLKDWGYKDDDR
jgi:hypothetical protein